MAEPQYKLPHGASVKCGGFELSPDAGRSGVIIRLTGEWSRRGRPPAAADVISAVHGYIAASPPSQVTLDGQLLVAWDSTLTSLLYACSKEFGDRLQFYEVPSKAVDILSLAQRRATRADPGSRSGAKGTFVAIARWATKILSEMNIFLALIGEIIVALSRMLLGRSRFRWRDFWLFFYECGPRAVGLVTLISLLVGLILAFVASVQLREFGAQLYVANLVVLAMTREMGAIMASLIMAGRTGSAFAAQLGTMEVNEEIDALKTFGISPIELLVMPRLLALTLALPFLCIYADLMGVIGGMIIGTVLFDISTTLYLSQTTLAVTSGDIFFGVFKSVVFALIVAFSGCLRGLHSGRSALAVGEATTSAVVTSIVLIIVVDALFAVLANILGV